MDSKRTEKDRTEFVYALSRKKEDAIFFGNINDACKFTVDYADDIYPPNGMAAAEESAVVRDAGNPAVCSLRDAWKRCRKRGTTI